MKVTIQLRAVLDIDNGLEVLASLPSVTETDVEIILVLPHAGTEIRCTELADLLAAARLVLNRVLTQRSSRMATNEEAMAAAQRIIAEHRPMLEKLGDS